MPIYWLNIRFGAYHLIAGNDSKWWKFGLSYNDYHKGKSIFDIEVYDFCRPFNPQQGPLKLSVDDSARIMNLLQLLEHKKKSMEKEMENKQ